MKNPVIDRSFPDPTVLVVNGMYYAYATNVTAGGKLIHIQVSRSKDMQTWEELGDALPNGADWASGDYWAPHVLYDPDIRKYIMYYSGESKSEEHGKCLGVAVSDAPGGPFVDKGSPLLCGPDFINIDPFAFKDPKTGRKLLYWGSGHQPIKVQELASDWLNFKKDSRSVDLLLPGKEKRYTKLLEGAWIDYHKGYYYLYYSGDNCCGQEADYAVLIARSRKAEGPYVTMGEQKQKSSVILESYGNWLAPGHNSIFRNPSGQVFIAYHAIVKRSSGVVGSSRVMLISPIQYRNGWPSVVLDMK